MANKISVTILTKDSSKYLAKCLESLAVFDEIIILDNGSTDNTLEIAKQFKNVKIFTHKFIGFGELKNLAIEKTNNDWVLSIDSDEIISQELSTEILNLELSNNTIYRIKRKNHYKGIHIRCCGWNNDFVNRLFNKKNTRFNNNKVHESLLTEKQTILKLNSSINHYSFDSMEDLISKMNYYSTLWAQDNFNKKTSSILKIIAKTIFAFIRFYILQGGFLWGHSGLVIAISSTNGVFYKYAKLYELQKYNKLSDTH